MRAVIGTMRGSVPVLLGIALSVPGCRGPDTTSCRGCFSVGPEVPTLSARIRVLPVSGRSPDLQVSASLVNQTSTTFVVLQCPLVVRFSPYPPGSYGTAAADQCPSGAPRFLLLPGASSVMTRVLDADTLATFAPGQYRVAVNVTFYEAARTEGNTVAGLSAGIVQMPMDSASQPIDSTSH